jgi:hypothetical protein
MPTLPEVPYLLLIKFQNGTVRYTNEFKIILEGTLYPRHLEAANTIIKVYKAVSREDHENDKKGVKADD